MATQEINGIADAGDQHQSKEKQSGTEIDGETLEITVVVDHDKPFNAK